MAETTTVRAIDETKNGWKRCAKFVIYLAVFESIREKLFKPWAMSTSADQFVCLAQCILKVESEDEDEDADDKCR